MFLRSNVLIEVQVSPSHLESSKVMEKFSSQTRPFLLLFKSQKQPAREGTLVAKINARQLSRGYQKNWSSYGVLEKNMSNFKRAKKLNPHHWKDHGWRSVEVTLLPQRSRLQLWSSVIGAS